MINFLHAVLSAPRILCLTLVFEDIILKLYFP
jgi:hypothetical protein